ncbi:MAG: DUF1080 domain-containing protein [Gemmataceae bacterium]|nr:DUF1080 domain-containing protein [Gemmataceae bacterium]
MEPAPCTRMVLLVLAGLCLGAVRSAAADRPDSLPLEDACSGWLMLLEGESPLCWEFAGPVEVRDDTLIVGGEKPAKMTSKVRLGPGEFRWSYRYVGPPDLTFEHGSRRRLTPTQHRLIAETERLESAEPVVITVPAGGQLRILDASFRPDYSIPLFDGRSLKGWKRFSGDPKREKSQFSVTPEGWLHVLGGPGDLQSERQFADFFLHVECRTNGSGLNSGIFFRALPGEYQQGYEAQIHHGFNGGDRGRPSDFGTGGIYRRKPARRIVAQDHEWFVLTVAADGERILTWVNGYPVCDFRDDRPAHPNPRSGRKTSAGAISIQGHDPTTDLHFRKIQVCPLPSKLK